MRTLILTLAGLFLFNCSSTVYIQPRIHNLDSNVIIDTDAGIYIPTESMMKSSNKFNLLIGENINIPVGTPFKNMAEETFAPYFNRVFKAARREYNSNDYLIELQILEFEITTGLDTHLSIKCKISNEDEIIFSGIFDGHGSGYAIVGLLDDDDHGRDQIRKSAEKAFQDAFTKLQSAFVEEINRSK